MGSGIKSKVIVKKNYKEIPPAEIIRFGNEFVDEFFLTDNKATEIPISAMRIIFNIASALRNEQFQTDKQPKQLKLFEEEFASEHSSYAQMKIKNSLITRNSSVLQDAYKFLRRYKEDWYSFTTSDGRKIKALGGLITNVFYEENGYTSFLISSYWIKKLIHIPEYNTTLYNLVYNVRSNKHILFWFWLSKLPYDGTKISYKTLNRMFNLDYKNAKTLSKNFLKSIRENLNKFSHKSFNYSIQGENIHIQPYAVKTISDSLSSEKTKVKVLKNYKIRYLKERHSLSDTEIKGIANIYKLGGSDLLFLQDAYAEFVANCRRTKTPALSFKNQEFINSFQEFLRIEYLKSEVGKRYPEGYPRI